MQYDANTLRCAMPPECGLWTAEELDQWLAEDEAVAEVCFNGATPDDIHQELVRKFGEQYNTHAYLELYKFVLKTVVDWKPTVPSTADDMSPASNVSIKLGTLAIGYARALALCVIAPPLLLALVLVAVSSAIAFLTLVISIVAPNCPIGGQPIP